ncbi:conserved hypothetical protein [Altererythrobacter sp. B11]|uniref:hypothetical protein n=1 Tax=Altererythrobacter sp. B11 TaxID=2060312 RepID=UPI000DC70ED6|nr:hypothetical protein [Altererythrobacter sp. B11]BBC72283.1 conserved hypothetical protein [Altererythrobacter sp. B11]
MAMDFKRIMLPCVLAAALAGCAATPDSYPSLAIRPGERVEGTMVSAPEEPFLPPPVAPGTLGTADSYLATVQAAHQAFEAEQARVASTVRAGKGAAPGTEAWSRAHVALADLERVRSRAVIALADFNQLYVDTAVDGEALERLAAMREELTGLVDEEDRVIHDLATDLR